MTRNSERGSAMLVTMIVITALLAGAAVLVSMQMSSSRSADVSRGSTLSLHCAEAGLVSARTAVANNLNQWDTALAGYPSTAEPTWLATAIGSHDIDGDGAADFAIYLLDNEDESSGNDPRHNSDLQVFVVSRCLKYPETPREVRELVEFTAGSHVYESQAGGGTGANNRTQ
jgi:hypothetical protein